MSIRWITAFSISCLLGSCALPQRFETYHYDRDSVVAYRYAGRDGNLLDEIRISLQRAKPFLFRLPNGAWINSQEITREALLRHGISTHRDEDKSLISWHQDRSLLADLAGRHRYFMFILDSGGRPTSLYVSACGYAFEELFATTGGTKTYGFPLTVQQAEELFGKPESIEAISIITGFTCL